jgi:hypothetical protein
MWTRMRTRLRKAADDDLKSTKPRIKGRGGKPGDVLDDGTPNPETDLGRAKLIQKLELAGGDLRLRSQLLDKALKKITDAGDREDFRNQLYDIVAGFIKLKNTDIVGFSKELVDVITKYEHARGRKIDPKVVDYLRVARIARVHAAAANQR